MVGKYLFEGLLGLPTDVMLASEFEFAADALDPSPWLYSSASQEKLPIH
jgi:glucosamine 6-phosphate synthetase-like amidotransferase/phosphosugar isomerase protein